MTTCSCNDTPAVRAAVTEPFDSPYPVPAYPPAEWYTEKPDWLTPNTKVSVDDDGRVAGYFYHHGQCLVHDAAACPRPSVTRYAAFHQQEVVTADGSALVVGVIGDVGGHADPYASVGVAMRHYADPACQKIICRAYDDDIGGVILGSMVPNATYADVALVRRSALSGDWRPMPSAWWDAFGVRAAAVTECEGYDCIGPTLVTRPGLPLVQRFTDGARAASILGGDGGIQIDEQEQHMAIDNSTVIEVPGGVTVRVPGQPTAPAGAHPIEPEAARVAAPPDGPPETEGPDEESAEAARLDVLEERIVALEDVVRQLIDAMQPAQAAAPLPA